IGLVPLLVGIFAVSEIITRLSEQSQESDQPLPRVGFQFPTWQLLRKSWKILLKSSGIGTVLGVLPGIGPTAASFVSYAETKRSLGNSKNMGSGEPEGVMATESANNAVTGGALVPTLALGIPGDPITAIMLGALIIHDIVPGPQLFATNSHIVMAILLSLLLVNVVILGFGAISSHLWTRVLKIPEPVLMGTVVVLVCVGVYSVNNSHLDLVIAFLAGILGFFMRLKGFPVAPVVIGFVLGPMMEENLRIGLIVYNNDIVAFASQPISLAVFVLTLVILTSPVIAKQMARLRRNQK
ncbi:MAG: tripartite tricarboxylate transporter permease, partial [Natronospirillum sp.]